MSADGSAAPASPFRLFVGLAVVCLLLLLSVASVRSYRDLAAAREREQTLRAQILATRERIHSLDRRIEQLGDDPATLERLAREELGMVRPGDVVIVLPDEELAPSRSAVPPAGGSGTVAPEPAAASAAVTPRSP